ENDWADIAKEQFYLESKEDGLSMFNGEFFSHPEKWERLKDACLFAVEEKTGEVAAMLTLWEGGIVKGDRRRVHWVATREKFQGKGIIKAMMTYAMDLYHKQGSEGPCILATGTQSWQAIRIYKKFGFEAYLGYENQPEPDDDINLAEELEAWEIIDGKIAAFDSGRK
ncbi:MAG: GNAT family N-acetyltransferase, partial [Clostridia bacterium]|nr:GNAT family N-acetyltransferase [Clostridia bacterium]